MHFKRPSKHCSIQKKIVSPILTYTYRKMRIYIFSNTHKYKLQTRRVIKKARYLIQTDGCVVVSPRLTHVMVFYFHLQFEESVASWQRYRFKLILC